MLGKFNSRDSRRDSRESFTISKLKAKFPKPETNLISENGSGKNRKTGIFGKSLITFTHGFAFVLYLAVQTKNRFKYQLKKDVNILKNKYHELSFRYPQEYSTIHD